MNPIREQKKREQAVCRMVFAAVAGMAACAFLACGGCENAGLDKLMGLETGDVDVSNSGTLSVVNNHVEGSNNTQDQSERTRTEAK